MKLSHGSGIFAVTRRIGGIAATLFILQSFAYGSVRELVSLGITPHTSNIALGREVQFKATGTFSDGSTEDLTKASTWTSSDAGIVSLGSDGLASSHTMGTVKIVAASGGHAGSAELVVSKAVLVSLAITPPQVSIPVGDTLQLTATGTFSDKSTQEMTSQVKWAAEHPQIANVRSTGFVETYSTGATTFTAALGSVNAAAHLIVASAALVSLSVTSNHASIPLGTATQFTAKGTYTDHSVHDLTDSVLWTCSPPNLLSVSSSGLATGKVMGTATVNAKSGSISGMSKLTVSAPVISSVRVTSDTKVMPLDTSLQLIANGMFTDGSIRNLTTAATWTSASSKIVSVNGSGLAVANQLGETAVFAQIGAAKGGVVLTVSPAALVSIGISPAKPAVMLGSSLQLAASGVYTDGSTRDVTQTASWTMNNPAIATMTGGGVAVAQQVGSTGVEATVGNVMGSTILSVQPLAAVAYFTHATGDADTAIRITNTGSTGQNLCAMVYVFDQDQQMAECCGCRVSPDGLRTFSLSSDFLSNPLVGVAPVAGSVMVVPSDYASNPQCNAASITPSGLLASWSTHLQDLPNGLAAITEQAFSPTPLGSTLSSALQAQCQFVQTLGSGHGICTCGTGD